MVFMIFGCLEISAAFSSVVTEGAQKKQNYIVNEHYLLYRQQFSNSGSRVLLPSMAIGENGEHDEHGVHDEKGLRDETIASGRTTPFPPSLPLSSADLTRCISIQLSTYYYS